MAEVVQIRWGKPTVVQNLVVEEYWARWRTGQIEQAFDPAYQQLLLEGRLAAAEHNRLAREKSRGFQPARSREGVDR